MGLITRELMENAVCSDDELLEATFLGDWEVAEEVSHDRSTGKDYTVSITISHYKGKMYVLNSKIGVQIL